MISFICPVPKNKRAEVWEELRTVSAEAGLGGGGVTSLPANLKVVGSSPAWMVSSLPKACVFVRPNLFEWQCGWCKMTLAVEAPKKQKY
jgi:hypothetical protein